MTKKPGQIVKDYLGTRRISKFNFDDLSIVADELINENLEKINIVLNWFVYLQENEIIGWRNKANTKKIARILVDSLKNKSARFYALFCPSYKKGDGAFGVRTDGVGDTTVSGLANLKIWHDAAVKFGFNLEKPLAVFFNIALEQADKIIENNLLGDLEININNFKKEVPEEIEFIRLSELIPEVIKEIGPKGAIFDPLPVPKEVFNRIVERGKKFYVLFGWGDEQIDKRSKIIASSESYVGNKLKNVLPTGIMLYTPTMLERAQVYSGFEYNSNPLPIIFPTKGS